MMENNLLPSDSTARSRVLDPHTSFAVTAPAGSGKTGLLTQRLLTLLQHVETPEAIIAITFTKKAANEMQERILHALQVSQTQPRPKDSYAQKTWDLAKNVLIRDAEKNWQLLKNPRRLRIQTIDSLCRSITAQLPFDSQLGETPNTLDNPNLAYSEAVRSFLKLLETDDTYAPDLERLFRHMDNNQVALEKLFVSLLQKREQWLPVIHSAKHHQAREYLEQSLDAVIREHLNVTSRLLTPFNSELSLIIDKAATHIGEILPDSALLDLKGITALPEAYPENLDQWNIIADFLLTKTDTYKVKPNKNHGFPAGKENAVHKENFINLTHALNEIAPELKACIADIRKLPKPRYNDSEWNILDSLTRLLPRLAAELTLTFKGIGGTDFTEITLAAIFALGHDDAPTDIALKLDHIIQHILVDEFQDTALPQLNLLRKLTAGWEPQDGRTLFIVGDGMQSCYGFRNAKVGLFLDAKLHGIGSVQLQAEELKVNFRSNAGIVEWVNNTFVDAFPLTDDISRGAVSYNASEAFKPLGDDPATEVFISTYTTDKNIAHGIEKSQAEKQEALAVAHLISLAKEKDPKGSIAILVRGRAHLREIIPTLQIHNIEFQATDIDALDSRMVIGDIFSLTRALLRFDDRIAWLSILRAPWCGLDLHDLYHLANTNLGSISPSFDSTGYPILWQQLVHRENIQTLSEDGNKILQRFMSILEPAIAARQRKPLRAWIYGVWISLGGPACLHDTRDHQNAAQFFETLEYFDVGGQIDDWQNFEVAIEKLYAAPTINTHSNVHILTLHKSKGLEFDTVIIPGLNRRTSSDSRELLLWHERIASNATGELLLAPIAKTGKADDTIYQYIAKEKKLQAEYEATRLLYVGCTRAIRKLYLLGCLAHTEEKPCQTQKAGGLLGSIWPQVSASAQFTQALPITQPTAMHLTKNTREPQHWILRLPSHWTCPKPTDNTQLAHLRGKTDQGQDPTNNNAPEKEAPSSQVARHTGTIVHKILQQLTTKPLPDNEEQWSLSQEVLWKNLLSDQGITSTFLSHALKRTTAAIIATLKDPKGRWILDHKHDQAASEFSIIQAQKPQVFREYILDRTFIDEGIRWIIDYKTSEPSQDETTDTFIQAEIQSYKKQLEDYRALFPQANQAVKIALYFPFLPLNERLVLLN